MTLAQNVQRVTLQPAYVLHARDYRDSSMIVDFLTPEYGRVSLVVKGAKGSRSNRRALVQPFRSLLLSWQGRGSLQNLTAVEESGRAMLLQGIHQICGYYITELLHRLLSQGEVTAELFALYDRCIRELDQKKSVEPMLREFELSLLQSLGLLADLTVCIDDDSIVSPDITYYFEPEAGVRMAGVAHRAVAAKASGRTLLGLSHRDFSSPQVLSESKGLMRAILRYYLGEKPIKSRELFEVYRRVPARK